MGSVWVKCGFGSALTSAFPDFCFSQLAARHITEFLWGMNKLRDRPLNIYRNYSLNSCAAAQVSLRLQEQTSIHQKPRDGQRAEEKVILDGKSHKRSFTDHAHNEKQSRAVGRVRFWNEARWVQLSLPLPSRVFECVCFSFPTWKVWKKISIKSYSLLCTYPMPASVPSTLHILSTRGGDYHLHFQTWTLKLRYETTILQDS